MNILSVKSIKILSLLFIVSIFLVFILPHMVNLGKYSKLIVKEIEKKTGYQVSIGGDPYIEASNKIKLIIPNLSITKKENNISQDFLQADNIIIALSWHNFMLGVNDFNSIEINNPNITLNYMNNFDFVDSMKRNFDLDYFIIRNGSLFYSNSSEAALSAVNLITEFNYNDIAVTKGDFINNNIIFNVDSSFSCNKKDAIKRALNMHIYNSDINLNLHTKAEQSGSVGNLKISITNPSVMVNYFAMILPFLDNFKNNETQNNIEILADVYHQDGNVNLTNFKISSDTTSGNGNLSFSFVDNINLNVNLNFDKIDLDTIFSIGKIQEVEISHNQILGGENNAIPTNNSFINLDFINNNINIAITSKEIKVDKIKLENFNFNFNLANKIISNSNIIFDITNKDNSSNFSISDISIHNVDGTNLFLGKFINSGNNINDTLDLFGLNGSLNIEENHLNYSLNAQMVFAPSEISLFNIIGKVGQNEGNFHGSVATRRSDTENYNIDLIFDHIALDNFNLPIFKARLQDLMVGSEQDNYLSKFIWFRTLTSAYTIKFGFTNTEFKNNKIDDLSVLCYLTPANMQLRGLIKAPFMDSAFSVDLEAVSIKPSINAKLYGKSLDYDFTTSLISSILPEDSAVNTDDPNVIWSDKNLNIFRINKYNASFDVDLQSLKFYDHVLNNFKLTSHTSNDILYFDNLGFDIYNGHIQTAGNISFFTRLLYQFSITGSNIESKNFFADFVPTIDAFEGPISFTSSCIAEGSSPKELISNLNISSNFASSGMTISGINSDVTVDIALQRKATPKEQMLSAISDSLTHGATNITGLTGSFKGTKGVIQSNDITFKSRFNSIMSAFSLDFNTLLLASNTQFLFMPYVGNNPITYNIIVSGNLKDALHREVDQSTLVAYIKATYNIVTAEDILEAKKAKKVQSKRSGQQNQIQDPNDKNYLYYKILEQEDGN